MNFHVIGVNHNSAPLEVRERLAVPEAQLPDAIRSLVQQPGVDEGMVLSTCNRVEVVTSTKQGADLRGFLGSYFGVNPTALNSHIYEFEQREAVRARIPRGFQPGLHGRGRTADSGPGKGSLRSGARVGRNPFRAGRAAIPRFCRGQARAVRDSIGSSSVSIASVAVQLAEKIFGSLEDKTVYLVGAGKMAELAARHLIAHGAKNIIVSNRTHERAVELAEEFGGRAAAVRAAA